MGIELEDLLEATAARRAELPTPEVRQSLRVAARLTQDEVAAVLGVDRATVSRWEAGVREPRGPNRAAYAALLERLRHV